MLKINMEYRKGILFVRLKGNLTRLTTKHFKNYLIPIIENQGIKFLVFNLANVNILDNSGKEVLKYCADLIRQNNGISLICNSQNKFENNLKVVDNELIALKIINI